MKPILLKPLLNLVIDLYHIYYIIETLGKRINRIVPDAFIP